MGNRGGDTVDNQYKTYIRVGRDGDAKVACENAMEGSSVLFALFGRQGMENVEVLDKERTCVVMS